LICLQGESNAGDLAPLTHPAADCRPQPYSDGLGSAAWNPAHQFLNPTRMSGSILLNIFQALFEALDYGLFAQHFHYFKKAGAFRPTRKGHPDRLRNFSELHFQIFRRIPEDRFQARFVECLQLG
jgi:hypothetical protein